MESHETATPDPKDIRIKKIIIVAAIAGIVVGTVLILYALLGTSLFDFGGPPSP